MNIQSLKVAIATAFGASFVILAGQPALAAPEGKLAEQMQLSLVPEGGKFLSVISDDGVTYNRFEPGSYVPYHGNIKIKMRRGRVRGWSLYWGMCDDDDCNNFIGNGFLYGVFEDDAKLVDKQISVPLFADAIPGGQGGLNPNPTAAQIISRCNEAASGSPPNKAHEFGESVPVSLGVDTFISVGWGAPGFIEGPYQVGDVDKAKTIDIALPIRCEPLQPTPVAAGDVQTELPDLELVATDLALQKGQDLPAASLTYAGSCPLGITLHVGATTNIKGDVHGYIQHKSADGVDWQSPEFTMTTSSTDGALWKKVWTDLQQLPFQQAGVPLNPGGGGVVDNQPSGGLQMGTGSGDGLDPAGALGAGNHEIAEGRHIGYYRYIAYTKKTVLPIGPGGSDVVAYENYKHTPWRKYDVTCEPEQSDVAVGSPDDVVVTQPAGAQQSTEAAIVRTGQSDEIVSDVVREGTVKVPGKAEAERRRKAAEAAAILRKNAAKDRRKKAAKAAKRRKAAAKRAKKSTKALKRVSQAENNRKNAKSFLLRKKKVR